jgi:hypothetical protein
MAYSPASLACGSNVSAMIEIDRIAVEVTKAIRHMDRIEYDPEGQRIMKLLVPALREAYQLGVPIDDGTTTSVTMEKDIAFKVSGIAEVKPSTTVSLDTPWMGNCEICKVPHDPRRVYDHAAVAPGRK